MAFVFAVVLLPRHMNSFSPVLSFHGTVPVPVIGIAFWARVILRPLRSDVPAGCFGSHFGTESTPEDRNDQCHPSRVTVERILLCVCV